ncbi:pimeloyl-ACP methyl ester carboxylesterase [Sphingobium boeckii]|uniref:Pimeloyl-ACP methyl ester carboxylesterase n=2 Tax=Sphingobium boeckii TaxID=1082345 RepID=A0A7W9AJT4_9SPHN|nr:pimeloyl-ACP methyl ester carboxylesterase [Sphingobium boeckii]
MATYVLVHGGGHGGWVYQKVARLLRQAGHEVYTPTLSGLGERAHLRHPDIDLDTHITDIVAVLTYEDLRDVILVGHSYGGMVITGVADRAAERIRELVYLDAAHPRNGESLATVAPQQMEPTYAGAKTVDGVELVMWPFPGMAGFLGVTDPDDVAWTESKLTPHPWKCFSQPLTLTHGTSTLPRTNINCTESLRNSPEPARARQLEGDHNFEIDTGHDLMITEPEAVTACLLKRA